MSKKEEKDIHNVMIGWNKIFMLSDMRRLEATLYLRNIPSSLFLEPTKVIGDLQDIILNEHLAHCNMPFFGTEKRMNAMIK